MHKLVKGIHHFQTQIVDAQRSLFERFKEGQNPETLFITCSDSRIDVSLMLQTEPGELFILRNAGNIVPPYGAIFGGETATIEYGVAALGVKEIIVCGHSHCGAIRALLGPLAAQDLPATTAWLRYAESTRRIVKENYSDLTDDEERRDVATQENVLVQLEHLRTHPVVAAATGRGDLHLHGWIYDIENGQITAYDPMVGQFIPLADAPARPIPSERKIRPDRRREI